MEKMRMLIADGTEEFRIALADMLRGVYQVRTCGSGDQAQALIHSFKPEVMVLDLMLPGLDGISLLQWAIDTGCRPIVLATTRFTSDYVLESANRLGVGYLMIKPCDIRATAARVGDLTTRIHPPVPEHMSARTQVSNLLTVMGVSTKLRGYGYLREAVLLMSRDPGQSITKILYPEVARVCGCEAFHVERSIRSAIAAAWENRDEQIWRLYFQPDATGIIPRPTNGTFISRLAERLQMERHGDE